MRKIISFTFLVLLSATGFACPPHYFFLNFTGIQTFRIQDINQPTTYIDVTGNGQIVADFFDNVLQYTNCNTVIFADNVCYSIRPLNSTVNAGVIMIKFNGGPIPNHPGGVTFTYDNISGEFNRPIAGNTNGYVYTIEDAVGNSVLTCPFCPSNITITGPAYNTPLRESGTWIKSSGQTTILSTAAVKLDANPTNGFVELKPAATTDFFLAAPTATGVFIAQALDGCGTGVPMRQMDSEGKTEEKTIQPFTLYPNPTHSNFTVAFEEAFTGEIAVYNLQGVLVTKTSVEGALQTNLSLQTAAAGMYIVQLQGIDGVKQVGKIVKIE